MRSISCNDEIVQDGFKGISMAFINKRRTSWPTDQRNKIKATHIAATKLEATDLVAKKETEIDQAQETDWPTQVTHTEIKTTHSAQTTCEPDSVVQKETDWSAPTQHTEIGTTHVAKAQYVPMDFVDQDCVDKTEINAPQELSWPTKVRGSGIRTSRVGEVKYDAAASVPQEAYINKPQESNGFAQVQHTEITAEPVVDVTLESIDSVIQSEPELGDAQESSWLTQAQHTEITAEPVVDTAYEFIDSIGESEINNTQVSSAYTLGAAVARYLETVSKYKSTWKLDKVGLDSALLYFGADTKLSSVTQDAVTNWLNLKLKENKDSTVKRYKTTLVQMLKMAAREWHWIEKNPFNRTTSSALNPPRTARWTWQLIRKVLRAPEDNPAIREVKIAFRISLHTSLSLYDVLTGWFDPQRGVILLPNPDISGMPEEVPVLERSMRLVSEHMGRFTLISREVSLAFNQLCNRLLIDHVTFQDARSSALIWFAPKMSPTQWLRVSRYKGQAPLKIYYEIVGQPPLSLSDMIHKPKI
jgi:hypothetical protein